MYGFPVKNPVNRNPYRHFPHCHYHDGDRDHGHGIELLLEQLNGQALLARGAHEVIPDVTGIC